MNKINTSFSNFKEEAELFFVTKFISGKRIEQVFKKCLDIIFGLSKDYDSNRGIIAYTPSYGQGKSFFFDVVNHRIRRTKGKFQYKRTTARELCDIYTNTEKGTDPKENLKRFIKVRNLFIDDIGDELKDGVERSNYANKLNVMRYVLLMRYDFWNEKGWKTYGTTNMTVNQFSKHYDGRIGDRILQMCYWENFEFISEGSFRQLEGTRKLTQEEIALNWKKFEKPKVIEKIDLEKYFNELLTEEDGYFENKDVSFWSFVKEYLTDIGILAPEDFDAIDEGMLDASELLLRNDIRRSKRITMKNAPSVVRSSEMDRALNGIKRKHIYDVAENIIARRKFFELRTQNYNFYETKKQQ